MQRGFKKGQRQNRLFKNCGTVTKRYNIHTKGIPEEERK